MDEKELEQEKGEKNEKAPNVKEILSWIIPFVAALLIAVFLKNYIIINANVPSGSMENTIMTGDRLIGNRLAYIRSNPKRGDIIIFHYPDNEQEIYVKRVIALPGEKVEVRDGKIYIDGSETPLDEPYLKEEWTVATGPYEFEVPEDSYLVLGDNRNDSWDARYWANKYVAEDKILGKAVFAYWPFSSFGKLE